MKTYQGHTNVKFSLSGAFGIYGASDYDRDVGEQAAFVVSGSEDGDVLWWDVQTKEVLQKEGGHEGVVLDVDAWDPGSLVVSGGLDRTVRVWERYIENGEQNGDEHTQLEKEGIKEGDEDVPGADEREHEDVEGDGEENGKSDVETYEKDDEVDGDVDEEGEDDREGDGGYGEE